MKKILFIITALPLYDRKGAAYSRILEYAKALVLDKGTSIYLLSFVYPDNLWKLKLEVIPNVFICGKKMKAKNGGSFLTRAIEKKIDAKKRTYFLKNLSNFLDQFDSKRSGFVYPSLMGYRLEKEIIRLFRTKSIPVFSERNELKYGIALNKPFPKNLLKKTIFAISYPFVVWDFHRQDKLVKYYDGNIVISTTLEKRIVKLNNNLIRIPILADVEKFNISLFTTPKDDVVNIGYTGSLTIKKDGLGELIKAISILNTRFGIRNIRLNIFGTGYRDTVAKLNKQILEYGLKENIIMHGSVLSEEIPNVLVQQDILILTRPLNIQTRYGFSTKLAEYMASGAVVVTTDVSDNLMFIKDGKNGFITDSHLADRTAEKLFDIISNKKYTDREILKNARETAIKFFSSKNYKEELSGFLFPNKNKNI